MLRWLTLLSFATVISLAGWKRPPGGGHPLPPPPADTLAESGKERAAPQGAGTPAMPVQALSSADIVRVATGPVEIGPTVPKPFSDPASVAATDDGRAARMQAHLKRHRCYAGKIDGVWGERSRKALRRAARAANRAVSPTTRPTVADEQFLADSAELCGNKAAPRVGDTAPAGLTPGRRSEGERSYLPHWMRDGVAVASAELSSASVSSEPGALADAAAADTAAPAIAKRRKRRVAYVKRPRAVASFRRRGYGSVRSGWTPDYWMWR